MPSKTPPKPPQDIARPGFRLGSRNAEELRDCLGYAASEEDQWTQVLAKLEGRLAREYWRLQSFRGKPSTANIRAALDPIPHLAEQLISALSRDRQHHTVIGALNAQGIDPDLWVVELRALEHAAGRALTELPTKSDSGAKLEALAAWRKELESDMREVFKAMRASNGGRSESVKELKAMQTSFAHACWHAIKRNPDSAAGRSTHSSRRKTTQ